LEWKLFAGVLEELKNEQCPDCKGHNICEILYGNAEKYQKLFPEKNIHPGGWEVSNNSPSWYCNDCENKWGQLVPDKTDSFDFDQGFNLDEVYDQ